MTEKQRLIFYLLLTAFISNLIWENLQAPLYTGFKSFGQHFLFCLVASLVDAVVILAFYFIISLIRKDAFWLLNIRPADILVLLALGLFTALLFEKWALQSGAWNYTSEMPVIFGFGLAPLIQLAILSLISVYAARFGLRDKVVKTN